MSVCLYMTHTLLHTSSDSTGFIIYGAVKNDELGYSVSGAGDVNGDGVDDVSYTYICLLTLLSYSITFF
jgi:hypothetical protein